MADIRSYKKDIQESPNGDRAKAYVVDAFRAINLDGPSAVTFYGLKENAYVKRNTSPIVLDSNTLEYRMAELIRKIQKTDDPADAIWIPDESARKAQANMLLTSKGFRKIVGALYQYPGV